MCVYVSLNETACLSISHSKHGAHQKFPPFSPFLLQPMRTAFSDKLHGSFVSKTIIQRRLASSAIFSIEHSAAAAAAGVKSTFLLRKEIARFFNLKMATNSLFIFWNFVLHCFAVEVVNKVQN